MMIAFEGGGGGGGGKREYTEDFTDSTWKEWRFQENSPDKLGSEMVVKVEKPCSRFEDQGKKLVSARNVWLIAVRELLLEFYSD